MEKNAVFSSPRFDVSWTDLRNMLIPQPVTMAKGMSYSDWSDLGTVPIPGLEGYRSWLTPETILEKEWRTVVPKGNLLFPETGGV